MKITFLGTRGYIDVRTRKHYRHTSTMITFKDKRVIIDCGLALAQARGFGVQVAYDGMEIDLK